MIQRLSPATHIFGLLYSGAAALASGSPIAGNDEVLNDGLKAGVLRGSARGGPRGARPLVAASWVHTRDVKKNLLDVLNEVLDSGHHHAVHEEVAQVEDVLRPMYKSLPKNRNRLLGHSAVRYALHRFFVGQHAMYVTGLEPAVDGWSAAGSPVDIIEDRLPAYVHRVFEDGLKEGFSLNDLAVLVVAFQHLVREDSRWRLAAIAKVKNIWPRQVVTVEEASDLVETYMISYLLGGNKTVTPEVLDHDRASVAWGVPSWREMRNFALGVWEEIRLSSESASDESSAGTRMVPFHAVETAVDAIGQRFGKWQDGDCQTMKRKLLDVEENGTGRVPLWAFRQAGGKDWQFSEDESKLRSGGVLDETIPGSPRVVIPNYLTARSNCISTSSLYSLCCIDECEGLMGSLEARVGSADVSPESIASVISELPSSTVNAPRTLDDSLLLRLDEISSRHGGRVKLHGRLFTSWMHKAYPRECSAPLHNVSAPRTADEWLSDKPPLMEDVLLAHGEEGEADVLIHDVTEQPSHEFRIMFRGLVAIAGIFALANAAVRVLGPAGKPYRGAKSKL